MDGSIATLFTIGASFTELTVTKKDSFPSKNPSKAVTVIFTVPLKFNVGVMVSWSPSIVTTTPSGLELTALTVNTSFSTSLAEIEIVNGISSSVT